MPFKKNTKTRKTPKTSDDLKAIRAKLKSIFDNNPLMIFILDKDGIIKELNSLGAKELGYELSELVDQPVTKVFYKEEWQTVKNQIAECLNNPTRTFNWEIRKVRKTGETIWVRENASLINSNGSSANILILCENISKIKDAEKLIDDSSLKIKQIVDASPYGVQVYELKEDERLIFTDYNSAADKILSGWNNTELE